MSAGGGAGGGEGGGAGGILPGCRGWYPDDYEEYEWAGQTSIGGERGGQDDSSEDHHGHARALERHSHLLPQPKGWLLYTTLRRSGILPVK